MKKDGKKEWSEPKLMVIEDVSSTAELSCTSGNSDTLTCSAGNSAVMQCSVGNSATFYS